MIFYDRKNEIKGKTLQLKYVDIPINQTVIPAQSGKTLLNWGGVGPSYLPGKTIVGAFLAFRAAADYIKRIAKSIQTQAEFIYPYIIRPMSLSL